MQLGATQMQTHRQVIAVAGNAICSSNSKQEGGLAVAFWGFTWAKRGLQGKEPLRQVRSSEQPALAASGSNAATQLALCLCS
jgi:hypothetical protein